LKQPWKKGVSLSRISSSESLENQVEGTIDYLSKANPRNIYASHCTDLNSKIALLKFFEVKEAGVGL